jgi:hypothetical protein
MDGESAVGARLNRGAVNWCSVVFRMGVWPNILDPSLRWGDGGLPDTTVIPAQAAVRRFGIQNVMTNTISNPGKA